MGRRFRLETAEEEEHPLIEQNKCLYTPLAEADPEVHDLVEKETWRQFSGLELIASEVSSGRGRK